MLARAGGTGGRAGILDFGKTHDTVSYRFIVYSILYRWLACKGAAASHVQGGEDVAQEQDVGTGGDVEPEAGCRIRRQKSA